MGLEMNKIEFNDLVQKYEKNCRSRIKKKLRKMQQKVSENIDLDKDTATIAVLDVVPTLTSSLESNISFHGQTAIIDYLDLSMNNLGQEKIYAKSLRKLVSGFDDEGYKCGTKMLDSWTLKLDMCDLGPIACRAIGKVC